MICCIVYNYAVLLQCESSYDGLVCWGMKMSRSTALLLNNYLTVESATHTLFALPTFTFWHSILFIRPSLNSLRAVATPVPAVYPIPSHPIVFAIHLNHATYRVKLQMLLDCLRNLEASYWVIFEKRSVWESPELMYTPKKTTQHISKIETLFVPNLAHLSLAQDQGACES